MVDTDILVSIIIPCYNQGRFLAEAIESALQQSYRNFEVIVVDDGSTDNTQDVAARYPEVITLRQENQGVSAARNYGLRASSGHHLVFLDSDDRLLNQAVEVGVKQLQNHTDCAMAFGRHRKIAADGALLSTTEYPVVEKDHYRKLLLSNYIHTPSTVMFRSSVFEALKGFDTDLKYAEDYDIYLRIAREFPIVGYDEIVAEYRRHDASMSRNYASVTKRCLSILRRQRPYVRGNKEWRAARRLGIRTYRQQWGEIFFREGPARLREGKEIKGAAEDVILLIRYSLEVFPRRLGRKISRSFSGLWSKQDLGPSNLE